MFIHEYYIVPKMVCSLVLGFDFLSEYGAMISCQGEVMEVSFKMNARHMTGIEVLSMDEARAGLEDVLRKRMNVFESGIGVANHYEHDIRITT